MKFRIISRTGRGLALLATALLSAQAQAASLQDLIQGNADQEFSSLILVVAGLVMMLYMSQRQSDRD